MYEYRDGGQIRMGLPSLLCAVPCRGNMPKVFSYPLVLNVYTWYELC